jgi:hypothetical protein
MPFLQRQLVPSRTISGVVEETVEDGPGDSSIPEDPALIPEGAVGGEDDGTPLVAAGEHLE